ncbi:MAG: hypothetical protein V3V20_09945 [Algisphaera sp.]
MSSRTAKLDGATSVGSQGAYRPGVRVDQVRVGSLFWKEGCFHRMGEQAGAALAIERPDAYALTHEDRSWTGRTTTWTWEGGGCVADLRTTLPGPRFSMLGTALSFRWLGGCDASEIESLTDDARWDLKGVPELAGRRLLLARKAKTNTMFLVVLSGPITGIEITSHAHWTVRASAPGAKVLIAHLAHENDVPRDPSRQAAWLDLIDAPPLQACETLVDRPEGLQLGQQFADAAWAPLPPGWAAWVGASQSGQSQAGQAGEADALLAVSSKTLHLLNLPAGPYVLAPGDTWAGTVATGWMNATLKPTGSVAEATELPEELAYPGDNSWRPDSAPLDRMMMLRVWAPLWDALDLATQTELRPFLEPPSAQAFRESLVHVEEPTLGRSWAKDALLFEEVGDVAYDPDWYNGLTLSGLARGATCAEAGLAQTCRTLAKALKPDRAALVAYFAVFSDWAMGATWTDARGVFVNANCLLNGMEGLLAERQLRQLEGDEPGAQEVTQLVVRTAITYLALHAQVDHARRMGWVADDQGGPHFGATMLSDEGGLTPLTVKSKNLYYFPTHFAQGAALLRGHGDLKALQVVLDAWDEKALSQHRRADWLGYYLEEDLKSPTYPCERREQGALSFLTAPEIIARTWIAGQDPAGMARRYGQPLRLPDPALLVMTLVFE